MDFNVEFKISFFCSSSFSALGMGFGILVYTIPLVTELLGSFGKELKFWNLLIKDVRNILKIGLHCSPL